MALGHSRNALRDLAILQAACRGATRDALASLYGLTMQRVQAILVAERHKLAVSPDPVYRAIRKQREARGLQILHDT
jgi:hypothetical protein